MDACDVRVVVLTRILLAKVNKNLIFATAKKQFLQIEFIVGYMRLPVFFLSVIDEVLITQMVSWLCCVTRWDGGVLRTVTALISLQF